MSVVYKASKTISQIIKDAGINQNSLMFAAVQARELMHEFVPFGEGKLSQNVRIIYQDNSKACVQYMQPYAKYCYYGEGKKFRREKHEKATAYWDRAMMQVHKGELTKRVGDFIR